MKNEITFIVRAFNEKIRVISCLNSIYRQNNKSFKVIVVTNLKEKYSDLQCVTVENKSDFIKASNQIIKSLDSKYFIYANKDTVFAPNAVDEILNNDSQAIIFNISRIYKGEFCPLYSETESFSFENYVLTSMHIWNNVFNTEFILKNNVFLKKLDYFNQLIFLLEMFSYVDSNESIAVIDDVIAYREKIVKPKEVSFKFFLKNRNKLYKIVKRFISKKMYSVAKKVVNDFVFDNIDVYYQQKNIFAKKVIKFLFNKFIFI